MTRAAIALGSNLDDRLAHLRFATDALTELGIVVSVSSLYETAPMGGPEQEPFFNAVVLLDTDLEPRRLLDELHRIEAEAGRVREVRWGPRRLDLDLILYGKRRVEDRGMVVPHPRFAERRFVLEPLVEVWPEAETSEGRPVTEYLPGVTDQEVTLLGTWWPEQGERLDLPAEVGRVRGPATFAGRGGWWVVAQGVVGVALITSVLVFDDTIEAGAWMRWLGAGLAAAGVFQAVLGLLHLGVSLTPYPEPLESGNLVLGGVYRYVRHPVYGGITLGMVGVAFYQSSWIGLIVAISGGFFFWLKSGFEERRLLVKYPGYREYRARTRARIIPWIV